MGEVKIGSGLTVNNKLEIRCTECPRKDAELRRVYRLVGYWHAESRRIDGFRDRVYEWVRTRIGEHALTPAERAMRLLEEAIELAQAEGITQEMVARQAAHVFARPAGKPVQEAGGVSICLLGWCGATGRDMVDVITQELERIEAKPMDEIRGSLARKAEADLFVSAANGEDSRG